MRAELLLFAGLLAAPALAEDPVESTEPTVSEAEGLTAYASVYTVLQHPRCLNCHPDGDVPLQTDDSTPHTMEITRLSVVSGLPCMTCHRETGVLLPDTPNIPPADPHWRMPAREQAFENRTAAQLCAQLNDPARTGDRDLAGLVEHVRSDHLVASSWHSPRTPPPISQEDFVAAFATWADAGGPCPK
ncbi:MAG: hypothetical protein ACI8RZ_004267 [Myxococcota bacterium]|jgi:hypothetical protein